MHTIAARTRSIRLMGWITLAAFVLAACAPGASPTSPPPTGAASADVSLPRSLYFLAKDPVGVTQVFRISRDGGAAVQVTSEKVDVSDYDVSPVDGIVAYVANNQLVLIGSDGQNRRVLDDGGPRESNYWVTSPLFSPDGATLAYDHQGVNFYELASGASHYVLEDEYSTHTLPNGLALPTMSYELLGFSPDGSKLLVNAGPPSDVPGNPSIYSLETAALVSVSGGGGGAGLTYSGAAWMPDSSGFYAIATTYDSTYRFGVLWKVDADTGTVTTLVPARADDGSLNLAESPYPAPDGHLYFFFGSYGIDSGYIDAPVVSLVRSDSGGAGRTALRDENFVLMTGVLWAPDASLVVVSSAPARSWNLEGGVLEAYPTQRQGGSMWLAPLGHAMKWGP